MTYDLTYVIVFFSGGLPDPTITTHQIITLQTKMPSFWLSTQSCETIRNHACFAGSHHNISTHQTFTKNTIHMHPKFGSSGSKGVVVCHMPTRSGLGARNGLGRTRRHGSQWETNRLMDLRWLTGASNDKMMSWCFQARKAISVDFSSRFKSSRQNQSQNVPIHPSPPSKLHEHITEIGDSKDTIQCQLLKPNWTYVRFLLVKLFNFPETKGENQPLWCSSKLESSNHHGRHIFIRIVYLGTLCHLGVTCTCGLYAYPWNQVDPKACPYRL